MSLNKRTKITFILPTLFAGGSERIFSFLAQNIDKAKFEATLLVIGKSSESAYDIEGINVIFFEKSRVLNGISLIVKYLRKEKPDIVISAIGHLNMLIAYISLGFGSTKFIAREATVIGTNAEIFKDQKKNIISFFLRINYFNFFDKIICQSTDMLVDIKNKYNVHDKKLIIINNPITNQILVKDTVITNTPIKLITIARLSKEKGVSRILELLSKTKIPFHYTLIGDGPEKDHIMLLIKQYNLKDKITYIPFTKEIEKQLIANDYFLQGSYVEGFPNALLESCAVGTPVIAFNVPGGTKEIVIDGVNGFLVNNEDEFLEKLQDNRKWNPKIVSESVFEKFNKETIIKQYETLFLDILKQN